MLCGLVLFYLYQTHTPPHHEAAETFVRSIVTTILPSACEQTRLEYTCYIMVYSRQDSERSCGTAFQLVQVITVQQKLVALSYFILTILYLLGARHLASSLISTARSFHTGGTINGSKQQTTIQIHLKIHLSLTQAGVRKIHPALGAGMNLHSYHRPGFQAFRGSRICCLCLP